MNGFCSCPNPQSCRCRVSQPALQQQDHLSGYPRSASTSFQTPSRAHIAMPSSLSPFTPRSRGLGLTQRHYTGAYDSHPSYNPITFYDTNHHSRSTNVYAYQSPHRNIPILTSMHPRGPQLQVPGYPPLPPVALNIHPPSAQPETGATKRKATTAPGRKPRAKRPRVLAPLDPGPVGVNRGSY